MSEAERSTITLRAIEGSPLRRQRIREMVIATAHAIGERNGIGVLGVRTDDESVTIDLAADRLAAIGFAAELRRLTTSWYTNKFGVPSLWGGGEGAP